MSAGWLAIRLVDAPDRVVMVSIDKILSIGSDPEGGSRIVLTSGEHYDVLDDISVLAAKLTQAGR
jgi:hypothetical protein